MAVATITGNLVDFGGRILLPYAPVLTFIPSNPSIYGNYLLSTREQSVVPDGTGSFTVQLMETEELDIDVYYKLRITWLDSAGGYAAVDVPNWKIRIPVGGGLFGSIIDTSGVSQLIYVGPTPPSTPYAYWLNDITGDLKPWS